MTSPSDIAESRSVVVERSLPFPPERVWRALTTPELLAEWLMRTDFAPEGGRAFTFAGDWGSVDCRVLEIDPPRALSYSWDAFGLRSVVAWTLTPEGAGTRLRLEQSGFAAGQDQFLSGAEASWPGFLDRLGQVLAQGA